MAKENKVMEIKDGVNTKQKEMERANIVSKTDKNIK